MAHMGRIEMHTSFGWGNLMEVDQLVSQGFDGR